MSSKDGNTKTLRFPDEVHTKLCRVAHKHKKSKQQLFAQMVEYFDRAGKDPGDITDEVLKGKVIKNHDNYLKVLCNQEALILLPRKGEIDRLVQSQVAIIDRFNNQVLEANERQLANQQTHREELKQMHAQLKVYGDKLDAKGQVKAKCLHILEQYVKERENMGFTTSSKEKERLMLFTKQQIVKL